MTYSFFNNIQRERTECHFIRCKLATHNEQMSKLPHVSLLQIFSATFLPDIISIGLQLGRLSPKIKSMNFKKYELFIATQCRLARLTDCLTH